MRGQVAILRVLKDVNEHYDEQSPQYQDVLERLFKYEKKALSAGIPPEMCLSKMHSKSMKPRTPRKLKKLFKKKVMRKTLIWRSDEIRIDEVRKFRWNEMRHQASTYHHRGRFLSSFFRLISR